MKQNCGNIFLILDNDCQSYVPSYSPPNSDPDDIKNHGIGMSIRGYSPIFSKWPKNPRKNGTSGRGESDEWTPADPREHLFFRIKKRKQGLYTSILVRFRWFLSSTGSEFWAESNGTTPVRHGSKLKEIFAQFGQYTRCAQYDLGFKV